MLNLIVECVSVVSGCWDSVECVSTISSSGSAWMMVEGWIIGDCVRVFRLVDSLNSCLARFFLASGEL